MSSLPPPTMPPPAGPPTPPVPPTTSRAKRPWWRRWWAITAAVVVVLIVIGAIASPKDDDKDAGESDRTSPSTTVTSDSEDVPTTTSPEADTETTAETTAAPVDVTDAPATTAEATTVPDTTAPPVAPPAIGDVVEIGDGGIARLNAVLPNASPTNEIFAPGPGLTLTRADVEVCAGDDSFTVNPLYWRAFLDDNTEAEVSLGGGDIETFSMAPGTCARGAVDFEVPDGRTVGDIVLTDTLLSESARWSTDRATPVAAPLTGSAEPAATLGTSLTFADGSTAVVRSAQPAAPPLNDLFGPDPGRQFVRIDVERCAGSGSTSVNPLYWLAVGADNWVGSAALGGGTLSSIDVAAGQCVAGLVEIDLPETSAPVAIVLLDPIFDELGRWAAS